MQELEKSLANWTQNLKELHTMKTDSNPAHSGGRRDGFEGANRTFAQTMGDLLLKSKSVNCRARLFLKFIEMSPKARQSRKELNFIEPGGPFQLEPGLVLFLEKPATRFNRFGSLFLQHSVLGTLYTLLIMSFFLKKKKNHLQSKGEGGLQFEQLCALCSRSGRDDKYQSLSESELQQRGPGWSRAVSLQYSVVGPAHSRVVLSAGPQQFLSATFRIHMQSSVYFK